MDRLDPATDAARGLVVDLAEEISGRFSDHWGDIPASFLALKLREWGRQIEDSNVWEPEHAKRILRALFSPAPELLAQDEMEYVMGVLSNSSAGGEARSKTIAAALAPRISDGA